MSGQQVPVPIGPLSTYERTGRKFLQGHPRISQGTLSPSAATTYRASRWEITVKTLDTPGLARVHQAQMDVHRRRRIGCKGLRESTEGRDAASGIPSDNASPFAVAIPTRRPVKAPGPCVTAIAVNSPAGSRPSARTRSTEARIVAE